jgi:hypothetical protein
VADEVHKILNKCEAVHISLDIDCLDPAFAPGTGIPEAGGLTSREVITLIKSLQGLPLVGLDVVEVAPPLDPSEATIFAALHIIMEFIAVIAREKQSTWNFIMHTAEMKCINNGALSISSPWKVVLNLAVRGSSPIGIHFIIGQLTIKSVLA